ncbi:mandelate racemase/muconate lactonizing enzyme family protein [Sporolactobacillus laevolacticus]|uniref:mandelate racemase/muconate lactonizing enzyme family protein n=1 Tax=Sporolactobacillus laevolacticus TaxID=33018 RepID=UPI0025B395A5|nr:dipeptide epimerase [Sporolactobacillus laevolacticus]MDN3953839.1 dipeptide epimerase [Sporolactobacillus laevolacticus]
MKIVDVQTKRLSIPLVKPFKTALRTVSTAESVVVFITCDDGTIGIGEAPPTHVITGDSLASIDYAIMDVIRPLIIGLEIEQKERINHVADKAILHNSSAKAAIDIAVYDCLAKRAGLPLYQLLGGNANHLETDFTVSVNHVDEMIEDALGFVAKGFNTLKIKVGNSTIEEDLERVKGLRQAVGNKIKLRLDANQGWNAKEAVAAIHKMENLGLDIELIEQPVPAWDFEGMKFVTEHVDTLIMADESIFSPSDAARLLAMHGCDIVNIKLMKAGGIYGAEKINALAEAYGVECMVGCMVESKVAVTAACHFAAAKANVTRCDLDTPLMFASDPVIGGAVYQQSQITLLDQPGLGIQDVQIK